MVGIKDNCQLSRFCFGTASSYTALCASQVALFLSSSVLLVLASSFEASTDVGLVKVAVAVTFATGCKACSILLSASAGSLLASSGCHSFLACQLLRSYTGVSLLKESVWYSGMAAMAITGAVGSSIGVTTLSVISLLSGLRMKVFCLEVILFCLGLPNGTITALVELFD
jgi:hypothetical protein